MGEFFYRGMEMKLSDKDLFQQIQNLIIDNGLNQWFDYGVNLINAVMPIFEICFGIYLLLWVLNYWANPSFTSMGIDFVKKCIAWSIVIALAFNAGNYKTVANQVYKFGDELTATVIVGNTSNQVNENAMDTIRNETNSAIEKAYKTGDEAFSGLKNSGKHLTFNFGVFVCHLLITFIIGITFAIFLMTKMCLLLVLMTAPFFIGCLLFEPTREWGKNWINTAFGYSLSILFYAAVLSLMTLIFTQHITLLINEALLKPKEEILGAVLGLVAIMFIVGIVVVLLITRVPEIAGALTGGNLGQVGGINSAIGGAVGGFAGSKAASGGKKFGKWLFAKKEKDNSVEGS